MSSYKTNLIEFLKSNRTLCESLMDSEPGYCLIYYHNGVLENYCKDVQCIDQYGGEDKGSEYWSVIEFTTHDDLTFRVRFEGWYASYMGSEFQRFYEVVGKVVMVTQWEKDTGETHEYNSYESGSY